jgi:hypothetical protein
MISTEGTRVRYLYQVRSFAAMLVYPCVVFLVFLRRRRMLENAFFSFSIRLFRRTVGLGRQVGAADKRNMGVTETLVNKHSYDWNSPLHITFNSLTQCRCCCTRTSHSLPQSTVKRIRESRARATVLCCAVRYTPHTYLFDPRIIIIIPLRCTGYCPNRHTT